MAQLARTNRARNYSVIDTPTYIFIAPEFQTPEIKANYLRNFPNAEFVDLPKGELLAEALIKTKLNIVVPSAQQKGQKINVVFDTHGEPGKLYVGGLGSDYMSSDNLMSYMVNIQKDKPYLKGLQILGCDSISDNANIHQFVSYAKTLKATLVAGASESTVPDTTKKGTQPIANGYFFSADPNGNFRTFKPLEKNLMGTAEDIILSALQGGHDPLKAMSYEEMDRKGCFSTAKNSAACLTDKAAYEDLTKYEDARAWLKEHPDKRDAEAESYVKIVGKKIDDYMQARKKNGTLDKHGALTEDGIRELAFMPDMIQQILGHTQPHSELWDKAVDNAVSLLGDNLMPGSVTNRVDATLYYVSMIMDRMADASGDPARVYDKFAEYAFKHPGQLNDNQKAVFMNLLGGDNIPGAMHKQALDMLAKSGGELTVGQNSTEVVNHVLAIAPQLDPKEVAPFLMEYSKSVHSQSPDGIFFKTSLLSEAVNRSSKLHDHENESTQALKDFLSSATPDQRKQAVDEIMTDYPDPQNPAHKIAQQSQEAPTNKATTPRTKPPGPGI